MASEVVVFLLILFYFFFNFSLSLMNLEQYFSYPTY